MMELPAEPLSDDYGFERGTPLDRKYIEGFLAAHRDAIRGSVLEVGDDHYAARFGGNKVSERHVVDIDATNPNATVVADLSAEGSLPAKAYDCIILTQTLHLLPEPGIGIENCQRALNRGGSLLLTAPALSRLSPTFPTSDFWRFMPAGIDRLFRRHWSGPFSVQSFGNLRVCLGFLLAEVVEDLPEQTLALNDHRYPLTVAVHAQPGNPGDA